MSEVKMTAADKACRYILDRVINDTDFAWVMLDTQAMYLAMMANAELRGMTEDQIRDEIDTHIKRRREGQRNQGERTRPKALLMTEQIEQMADVLEKILADRPEPCRTTESDYCREHNHFAPCPYGVARDILDNLGY